jgi:uncharacterized protein
MTLESLTPQNAGFVSGVHLVDSYGQGGFRFGEMSHKGSVIMLPSGVHAWSVGEGDILGPLDFSIIEQAAHDLDFFLIGTGRAHALLDARIKAFLATLQMSVDVMSTPAAVRTYNVMAAENRKVAAALMAVKEP